ncbi:Gag protease polyprotein [Theobroma cacao]|uniref:Gag protease polyprotein n=1 Tax=Theobroma cacao TaxID=3641 RepID=A0A061EU26_THECC|nr:Gag protease polyprotein [Theobroma cacao]
MCFVLVYYVLASFKIFEKNDQNTPITMPPRRGRPPLTRSVGRGRSRSQCHQPNTVEEESAASTIRAAPAAEQVDSPPHLPSPQPPTGIPAMPTEAAQALAAFFAAMAGQAQSGQVPPVVPPATPLVPPLVHDVSISKNLKEARQLGCVSFTGELDATVAKDWINQVSETLSDMGLDDDMKLMVATRLLEKRARTWWNSVKSRSATPQTWSDFLKEFDGQYFTYFHQKENKREFLSLKQGNLIVEEYETRFNELILYVPNLVKSEQDQASYFEEGLRNEIRERMIVTGREPHKEVVQMALQAKKLATENRRIQTEFAKRKNLAASSPPACIDMQRRDSSRLPLRQRVAIRSGVESNTPSHPPSRPQTRTATRVFVVTKDEARVRLGAVTSTMSLFDKDAYVLIDSGSDRSYVNTTFASIADRNLSPLEGEIIVHTPLGEQLIRNTCYRDCGIRIGGEPLDNGKGLYSRTENVSISTPNTWWGFPWIAYERGTVTQLYNYLRGEMLDEVSLEPWRSQWDTLTKVPARMILGDAEADTKPCGVSIGIRDNECLSGRHGGCHGPDGSSES